jgi:hypothetical protein
MARKLATMLTMTTYGTWLRGDARGWVEDGVLYPPDPELQSADARRMKHAAFRFDSADLLDVGQSLGTALCERKQQKMVALSVQSWHVHLVVAASRVPISDVVKCAKDAVRYALRPNRTIWTAGFDKRFCFDVDSAWQRVKYVERHNLARGLPARPWAFIEPFD